MTQQHDLSLGELNIRYVINPQHRDGNPNKSQWTIDEADELTCFSKTVDLVYIYGFGENKVCWGLHFVTGVVSYLGEAAANESNSTDKLFIAKFVCDNNDAWHGYPANSFVHVHDIPTNDILKLWLNNQYLSRAKIRKIAKGQKCTL